MKNLLNRLTLSNTVFGELLCGFEQIKSYVVFCLIAQTSDDAMREKEEKKRYLIRKVSHRFHK